MAPKKDDLDNASTREAEMEKRLDEMEGMAERADIAADTLAVDLRDAMLEQFKHRPKPWGQLLSGEQRDLAASLESTAKTFARKAVKLIAAADRPHIRGRLKKFAHDGGKVVATIEIPLITDETVLALNHATGKEVMMVTADADDFTGARAANTDADQSDLEFEAGSDEAPADDAESPMDTATALAEAEKENSEVA